MLKSAMKKYCFVLSTSCVDLKGKHEVKASSVLTAKVVLALADSLYSTRSARGQSSSAGDVFPKSNTGDAMRLIGNVSALGVH